MSLEVRSLSHRYGEVVALRELSLTIGDGEIVAVLGPSGSGKTTLLEILAGLLAPAAGEVLLDGQTISRPGFATPPERRNIGFVFQDFALWPHMTVAETVGFPLAMRRMPAGERRPRVDEVLALVQLEGYGGRYPHELSGGQRQRVAIARALAARPGLVLLDEPMSNLDARLRERMRQQIGEALRHEGVTAVYVTHDRAEALAVADRIAIIDQGRLVQAGTPQELYERPGSGFAASFLGPAALLPAHVLSALHGQVRIETMDGVSAVTGASHDWPAGQAGYWLVRPEHVTLTAGTKPTGTSVAVRARALTATYAGSHWLLELKVGEAHGAEITCHHASPVDPGQEVWLQVDPSRTWFIA